MEDNRALNALSYFSVIFAPFLVPLIIWILGKNSDVKYHAKRALISHIIPVVLMIILAIVVFVSAIADSASTGTGDTVALAMIIGFVVFGLVYLISFIWNIVQGIKVLMRS